MKELIRHILKEEISSNLPIKLSGSYRVPEKIPSRGDALHSFDRRKSDGFGGYMLTGGPIPSKWSGYITLNQGKSINQVLRELVDKGIKPDVTDITITINNYTVNWEATIDESNDGKSYVGVSSRGSAGSNADSRAISQIPKMKSINSEYCNWKEVLDLNVTKPFKIRQLFFKYTKCKEGEENNLDKIYDKLKNKGGKNIEGKVKDWIKNTGIEKKLKFKSFKDIIDSEEYKNLLKFLNVKENKEITKKILKEDRNPRKDRIIDMLHDVGYITTIQSLGGYENFKRVVGDNYLTKERKIELIGDITHQFGRRGELNLYDFDVHIMINKDEYDDGSFDATYVHYVEETGNFFHRTYSFDEEGWMDDNEIDEGYSPMSDLSEYDIDLILDDLINTFL